MVSHGQGWIGGNVGVGLDFFIFSINTEIQKLLCKYLNFEVEFVRSQMLGIKLKLLLVKIRKKQKLSYIGSSIPVCMHTTDMSFYL